MRLASLSMAMVLALATAIVGSACGSSSDASGAGGSCGAPAPESCPADVPSFKGTITPILNASCVSCHEPGSESAQYLQSYDEVFALRSSILDQVDACRMPPAGSPIAAENRTALLTWLVCGAPDN